MRCKLFHISQRLGSTNPRCVDCGVAEEGTLEQQDGREGGRGTGADGSEATWRWWRGAALGAAAGLTSCFSAFPADGRWALPVRLQRGAERHRSAAGQTKPGPAARGQQGQGLGALGQRLRLRLRPQRVGQKLPQWGRGPGAGGSAQHCSSAPLDQPQLRPLQGGSWQPRAPGAAPCPALSCQGNCSPAAQLLKIFHTPVVWAAPFFLSSPPTTKTKIPTNPQTNSMQRAVGQST